MKRLEGLSIAGHLIKQIKKQVGVLHHPPGLAFILIGDHPPSHSYVRMKKKRCAEVGMISEVHELVASTSENHLLELIQKLNAAPHIDGILVQQPLPPTYRLPRSSKRSTPLKTSTDSTL